MAEVNAENSFVNKEQQKTKEGKWNYTDIMPTGVLAIHLKRCRNVKLAEASAKSFSKRLPVNLYIKISVGEVSKLSSVCDVKYTNNVGAAFDDMKHILLKINNKIDDESNKVKLTLIGFQGNEKHKKLGEKEIHLFNIIKSLFLVETLELTKNAHVIGEIELEMAFSYGCFGYGYSSQLETKVNSPEEQISQSMFFRAEPPKDRRHDTKGIMTCIPTPHPPLIEWPAKVEIGLSGREYMTDSITDLLHGRDRKSSEAYPLLSARVSVRLPELQKRYASLTKRSQRIAFLQNLVTTRINPELEENQDEVLFGKERSKNAASMEGSLGNDGHDEAEQGLFTKMAGYFRIFGGRKKHNQESADNVELPREEIPMIQLAEPSRIASGSTPSVEAKS